MISDNRLDFLRFEKKGLVVERRGMQMRMNLKKCKVTHCYSGSRAQEMLFMYQSFLGKNAQKVKNLRHQNAFPSSS